MIELLAMFASTVWPVEGGECAYAAKPFLTQSYEEFDQSDLGWRRFADSGCYRAAQELIALYLQAGLAADPDDVRMLHWHEGQMHAYLGEYAEAIAAFEAARPGPAAPEIMTLKTEAVLAFLRRDKARLTEIRERMARMPEPQSFRVSVKRLLEKNPGITPPRWPLGLEEVERFIQCFDEPYIVAYDGDCAVNERTGDKAD